MLLPQRSACLPLRRLPDDPTLALRSRHAMVAETQILLSASGFIARRGREQHLTCALAFGGGGTGGLRLRGETRLLGLVHLPPQLLECVERGPDRHPSRVTEKGDLDDFPTVPVRMPSAGHSSNA